MSEGNISVRDSLNAAMTDLAEPTGAAAPVEAVVTTSEAAPEPVEAKAAPEAADTDSKPAGDRERGPDGKFLPKAEASAEAPPAPKTTETAPPAEPEPQETEAIRVPPSLSAAVKAQWKDLPPEVRKDIARLEETVQTAKAEWGKKGERLNRYDEIMAPRSEKLQLQGIDEFTFIKTLVAAQDFLERDPLGGIRYLANSYSVTPQQIAQAFGLTQASAPQPGAEGQAAPTAAPDLTAALQPFLQRVQTLEQRLQADTQRTEGEKLATARAEVTDFASKPENMYFENVKADVARRLESGAATTLQDAYEQATWASPEIRPLLLKAQVADAAKPNAAAAAALKAKNAGNASGSVTGSPSPGAVAPTGPIGSVRDTLQAAMQELGAV